MRKLYILVFFLLVMVKSASAQSVNLSEMPLDKKIAQMIIVRGDTFSEELGEIGIGGIFLDRQKDEESYAEIIAEYQSLSKIKLLVSTDLEGYWNPFPFFESKKFGEIETADEANNLGIVHGRILKELGFNINFAPIAESKNKVWPGRTFGGTNKEIKKKVVAYIEGIQSEKVLATAKHYPGGNMLRDPHWFKVNSEISEDDLNLFDEAIKSNVSAIMIGHAVVYGIVDSDGKQSTISPEVISYLRKDFNGLIITDAVQMLGLRWSYFFKTSKLYPDLVKAGNDIILDTSDLSADKIKRNIDKIKKEVDKGNIKEERIDESVERILKYKGYSVVR